MQARFSRKLGLLPIVVSCGMWAAVLVVPFLPWVGSGPSSTAIAQKALLTTSLLIASEVIFWVGRILIGKELAHRDRQKLNPYSLVAKSYSTKILSGSRSPSYFQALAGCC
jgi:hypothetical protein